MWPVYDVVLLHATLQWRITDLISQDSYSRSEDFSDKPAGSGRRGPEKPKCFLPEALEVAGTIRHDAVWLGEQRFGEVHHLVRFGIPQVAGIEVAQPHAVEAICILQQGCKPPVPMVPIQFPGQAVMDDG